MTTYIEDIISVDASEMAFSYLMNNTQWGEGIRSKKGFTRKASTLNYGENDLVDTILTHAMKKLAKYKYLIQGIYLNYYENGEMWTPNHSHSNTHQIVVSLGIERDLKVANKTYRMKTGSGIIFGSATHGVPKCDTEEGRISIAAFLIPIE